jgi:hypothetical protein
MMLIWASAALVIAALALGSYRCNLSMTPPNDRANADSQEHRHHSACPHDCPTMLAHPHERTQAGARGATRSAGRQGDTPFPLWAVAGHAIVWLVDGDDDAGARADFCSWTGRIALSVIARLDTYKIAQIIHVVSAIFLASLVVLHIAAASSTRSCGGTAR